MRTIGVVTCGRSDYAIYRPILRRIRATSGLRLMLIVTGSHFAPRFGRSVGRITADGFTVDARVNAMPRRDTAGGVVEAMGTGMRQFARLFERQRPDILLVMGDRYEMLTAVAAAAPFNIPVAHLHGGEITEGAMDELFRHAITKMSHLHLVATRLYARRIIRMGEEPWRVTVTGAPGLDNLREIVPLGLNELEKNLGMALRPAPLLVTVHPETLRPGKEKRQTAEVLKALAAQKRPLVFTRPCADPGGEYIARAIRSFVEHHSNARCFDELGPERYASLMRVAVAMVGNSSSGIIEAASYKLPVVNIGDRQRGRLHGRNVLDTPCQAAAIERTIRRAVSPAFRATLRRLVNPYGDGHAAQRVVRVLTAVRLDEKLRMKRFHE